MFPFLFGKHPYGYLHLGEKDRIAGFTAQDARNFWRKQIRQPWALSVCGSFDRQAMIDAAKSLPEPDAEAVSPAIPRWNEARELNLSLPGRNQSHLFLVYPTVPYGAEDEPGIELLQNILAGQSGLLFRELRDRQGLGYTVTAFPWRSEKAGALILYIGTEPDAMQRAGEAFRAVIAGLQTDLLPEDELERGKNQIEGDYYREHQTLSSRSAESAVLAALRRPPDAARSLVEKSRAVDAAAVRELARKYLRPEQAYTVRVLP
jgi:zinc protease